jgi:hypothetical protein
LVCSNKVWRSFSSSNNFLSDDEIFCRKIIPANIESAHLMANIEFTGGAKLEAVLKAMAEKSGEAQEVSIGFMAGATYPDGTSVPMIAALMNYGTMTIPPRPFFSNMVKSKSSGWGRSLGRVLKENDFDSAEALAAMGVGISAQLQASIRDTNSPQLAAATVARKGFSKPLIDTSHMINSVDYKVTQ